MYLAKATAIGVAYTLNRVQVTSSSSATATSEISYEDAFNREKKYK